MTVDQISKWVSTYAYSTPKKVTPTDFQELTEKKYKNSSLCGPKSSNICVIVFTETAPTDRKEQLDPLKEVIELFENDPVDFAYLDMYKESYIHQDVFADSKAVLYKPKRSKFMSLPVNSADALFAAISDALGGGGTWNKAEELLFGQKAGAAAHHTEL